MKLESLISKWETQKNKHRNNESFLVSHSFELEAKKEYQVWVTIDSILADLRQTLKEERND